MKAMKHNEFFGSLVKKEELSSINQNIILGSVVFESSSPFRAYYSDDVLDPSPIYIYIVTDKNYPVFDIIRAINHVKEKTGLDFDAAKAQIESTDKLYQVIRLRHFQHFGNISIIQKAFSDYGISLYMTSASVKDIQANVTIEKMFRLLPLSEEIWLDSDEPNHAYLQINRNLSMGEFVAVTEKVRNNWFESKFDAALGCFLEGQSVVDFVRVYTNKLELEYLVGIRNLYLEKIKLI